MTNEISKEFSKKLLTSMYKMDDFIGQLDQLYSELGEISEKDAKDKLKKVIGEILFLTTNELMVPIYSQQPKLGSVSAPGSWLKESSGGT